MHTNHNTTTTGAKPGWLTSSAAASAVLLSAALAGFGIASAFWPRLVAGDPVAIIAAAIIIGVVTVSECAAALLLVHAANRASEGAHLWAWLARFAFVACTAANVLTGHYGAEAINTRLVSPQRAPFESSLSSSQSLLTLANNTKADVEARHAREIAGLEREFEAERQANPLYVTARGRQQEEQRAAMRTRQAAELREAQGEISRATEEVSKAQADLDTAPRGFDASQMWGFALLLELLKGLLVRVATPSRRRVAASGAVAVLPQDRSAFDEMTDDEIAEIETRASVTKALAQQARKRRQKAA